ncbi:2-oxo-4-hydroxy-4-carboxy-5-ureidoimidazoline decarboxylase [Acidicapsa ligni]|uniref:2-oxo-4-hydroxy-4-carboxy-5-ureidoimidazoline decarboxylase n=1 Tax=Acidicapsa ligni TaxID=542300 RepID=UPI0021E04C4F|nr:2-oxo-4-hydroxy-4-carboxy-5-ureidoimidazoline decarboxylase [Acidicapsa ligni]
MIAILAAWNRKSAQEATGDLLSCCAANRWAAQLVALRPFADEEALYSAADQVWAEMEETDWMEAFLAHPRIGHRKTPHASAQSSHWSQQEQSSVNTAQSGVLEELAAGNQRYEERFGFTYIVCASSKSADEMLAILNRRLPGARQAELREAAEQQRQITQIRLRKWLQP